MDTSVSDPQLTATSTSPRADHPAWMKRVGYAISEVIHGSARTLGRCMLSSPSCEKNNVISDWSAQ